MKRFLLSLLVILLLALGVGWFFARRYVQSEQVATQVATKLQEYYGGIVEVKQVDVGLGGSSISGFKLYEKDTDAKYVWLEVESLSTDVSLWDVLRGTALPKNVTVEGATITLRFDPEGNLLTRFPVPAPTEEPTSLNLDDIPLGEIKRGQLVFKKAGHADLVVKEFNARLERQNNRMALTGTGESAELGKLSLDGSLDGESQKVAVHLKTDSAVRISGTDLLRLPFIPESVWEEVRIKHGTTPADVTASYDLKTHAVHYHVELTPTKTSLFVPALDLTAEEAAGKIIIDDYQVQLINVEGKAFDGALQISSELDFEGDAIRLRFTRIAVQNADIAEFPPSWNSEIPVRIQGRFNGSANMDVTIRVHPLAPTAVLGAVAMAWTPSELGPLRAAALLVAAKPKREIRTTGEGKGEIVGGTIGGQPVEEFKFKWLPAPPGSVPLGQKVSYWPDPQSITSAQEHALLALLAGQTLFLVQPASDPEINVLLGGVVRETLVGIENVVRGVADVGSGVFQRIPRKFDTNPNAPPQYLEVNLKLKQVSLAEFIEGLNVKLPYAVSGKASFEVKASLPLDQPGDLRAYKVHGTAQVTDFQIAELRLAEARADITVLNGILNLEGLKGSFARGKDASEAGSFNGSASLPFAPLGPVTVNLNLDRVPVDQLAPFSEGKVRLDGFLSGKLNAKGAGEKLKDADAWEADAVLTSERVGVQGLGITGAKASLRLAKGVLSITQLTGQLEGAPIEIAGEVKLAGTDPYTARLALDEWSLATLKRLKIALPVELAGTFGAELEVKGTLRPFTSSATGSARVQELKIENFLVKNANFKWEKTDDQLLVKDFVAQLYKGEATGSAVLPLEANKAGKVGLRFRNIDAQELSRSLPIPFKIEGNVDGELKGTFPPALEGKERTANVKLDLKAPKLRVQNFPAEQLQGTLDYHQGVLDYKLEGKSLGGSFELEGQVPTTETPTGKAPKQGRLNIKGVRLSRLGNALNQESLSPLSGLLNLNLSYSPGPKDGLPQGNGQFRIAGLRWGDRVLSNNLQGDIDVTSGIARVRNLTGTVAGGQFRAQVAYHLRDPERSGFVVNFDNAEASQLLAPFFGDNIEGPLQGRIRGNLGATWSGTADLELTRGQVYGLDVTGWRVPIHWQFAPGQNRGQIQIADTSAQIAQGRASGRLNVYWDYAARLDGEVKFHGIDVQNLLRKTVGATQIAGGQMSGKFTFEGRDVRSFDDLSGVFTASFSQAQALQLPVLSQLAPYLGIGPSTTFQKGNILARLGRGVLRVQHLNLEGGKYDLFIDGTVTTRGRLDLAVAAQLGIPGLPGDRFRLLGLRIPPVGPVPVALAIEASNLLANRTIYLQVTGTVANPVIRLQALPVLTDGAVRYFLTKGVPIPLGT